MTTLAKRRIESVDSEAPIEWWRQAAWSVTSAWPVSQAGVELRDATLKAIAEVSTVLDGYRLSVKSEGADSDARPNFPVWPDLGSARAVFVYAGRLEPRIVDGD